MPSGRPTKLTPALQSKICDAIRAGNYLETAAAYAGVNKTTLHRWMRDGARAKSGALYEFNLAIEKALADAEARDVALIAKAASDGVWQAAAWRLERKFPQRWGRGERRDSAQDKLVELEAVKLEAEIDLIQARAEEARRKVEPPSSPITVIVRNFDVPPEPDEYAAMAGAPPEMNRREPSESPC